MIRQRASSPRLLALNNALISCQSIVSPKEIGRDPVFRSWLIESAIGAYLTNSASEKSIEIFYWRDGNKEVDYVIRKGKSVTAIEVKSGFRKESLPGMVAFEKKIRPKNKFLVGGQGINIADFLLYDIEDLL